MVIGLRGSVIITVIYLAKDEKANIRRKVRVDKPNLSTKHVHVPWIGGLSFGACDDQ